MESQGNSPLQDEDVRLLQEITIPDGAIGLLQWRNDMVTYLTVDHIVSSVYCCDLVLPNSQRCIAASQPDGSPGKGPPILHGSSKAIHTPNSNYCCNFVQDNGEPCNKVYTQEQNIIKHKDKKKHHTYDANSPRQRRAENNPTLYAYKCTCGQSFTSLLFVTCHLSINNDNDTGDRCHSVTIKNIDTQENIPLLYTEHNFNSVRDCISTCVPWLSGNYFDL